MIYYIADIHFGDQSVINLCNRPFNSVEEYDNFIIQTWNRTVSNEDDVYIVGDFAYRNKINVEVYLNKLNGKKHLIIGNHDLKYLSKHSSIIEYFETINKMTMIKDGKNNIVLCHYPLAEWSGYFRGWYHVHGHVHNRKDNPSYEFLKSQEKALNAGVDINNFKPVAFKELVSNNKFFKER